MWETSRFKWKQFVIKNWSELSLFEEIVLVIEKNFWNSICKNFQITRTIYSNSERSGQFLVTECFSLLFYLFLEVSHIEWIRTIRIQIGKKILGFRKIQEKLENGIFSYCWQLWVLPKLFSTSKFSCPSLWKTEFSISRTCKQYSCIQRVFWC